MLRIYFFAVMVWGWRTGHWRWLYGIQALRGFPGIELDVDPVLDATTLLISGAGWRATAQGP
jgi:hypothetical protein